MQDWQERRSLKENPRLALARTVFSIRKRLLPGPVGKGRKSRNLCEKKRALKPFQFRTVMFP
ncbi:hypothetical protein B4135_1777 [Caldibacillus debilis]|uniref:Uncharacterized protein n=1 Tax=Caldibacillus debilis TaxID=301148 RepID=A0A150M7Y4_9BACI|nr:hypothetical protein B4135_1777 [Caldibacillus debilis]